jgi:hypothetical protein
MVGTGKWMVGGQKFPITNIDYDRVDEIKEPAVVIVCSSCDELKIKRLKLED